MRIKVCHITTGHPSKDIRIFYKECRSLQRAGYDTCLLAANADTEDIDGVSVIGMKIPFNNRTQKFLKTSRIIFKKALEVNADIYHFHDPDFLPYAVKLKKRGKKVIYDVHEDVPRQILSKTWINRLLRFPASVLFEMYENFVVRRFDYVIAVTKHIKTRLQKNNSNIVEVRNYPIVLEYVQNEDFADRHNEICYVGSIDKLRGVGEMVDAVEHLDVKLKLIGKSTSEEFMLHLKSKKGWVKVIEFGPLEPGKASQALAHSKAGLVTIHPVENNINALPTKMFEYMAAGIPVIASNFPLWKEIVEGNNCGVCVDPLNVAEISDAIAFIIDNPSKAAEMGSNGRKAVEEKYNWDLEEKKLLDVYHELVSRV